MSISVSLGFLATLSLQTLTATALLGIMFCKLELLSGAAILIMQVHIVGSQVTK